MASKQMRAQGASPEVAQIMANKMQKLFKANGVKDFAATMKDIAHIAHKSTQKGLTKALKGKAVLNSQGQVVSKKSVISASARHATKHALTA